MSLIDWAQTNNLKLNREKSVKIVFTGKRKHLDCKPLELPGISRVTEITILGVTVTIIYQLVDMSPALSTNVLRHSTR